MPNTSGPTLYRRAQDIIAGGVGLFSKRPDRFLPGQWPAYFTDAHGCRVTDLDGTTYNDFTHNGVGACLLGYGCPQVDWAVQEVIDRGTACTLNPAEEVYLAGRLLTLHPWAGMVRYTRSGGEAMAVAVRAARAYTGRDIIVSNGYHGWHDWYLARMFWRTGAEDLPTDGVPEALDQTHSHFKLNEFGLEMLRHWSEPVAAIVIELCRDTEPDPATLSALRAIATQLGAVLVVDEITSGFRFGMPGAAAKYGLTPDIAVYAKSISNGYPMAAIVGVRDVMAASTFISSTSWSERTGPAAALATLDVMGRIDVPLHVGEIGAYWQHRMRALGMADLVISGLPPLSHLAFHNDPDRVKLGYYTQEMLGRGFLVGAEFYPTLAHDETVVDKYVDSAKDVLTSMDCCWMPDEFRAALKGGPPIGGFRRGS